MHTPICPATTYVKSYRKVTYTYPKKEQHQRPRSGTEGDQTEGDGTRKNATCANDIHSSLDVIKTWINTCQLRGSWWKENLKGRAKIRDSIRKILIARFSVLSYTNKSIATKSKFEKSSSRLIGAKLLEIPYANLRQLKINNLRPILAEILNGNNWTGIL